jgi:hypothetical protein
VPARDARRFFFRKPQRMARRELIRQRRLVDRGGLDQIRRERDLGEELEAARRGRSQDEALMEVVSCQLSVLG